MNKTNSYFIKSKLSFFTATKKYLKDLMYIAKDDKDLLKDLFYLTILFLMLDWSYLMVTNDNKNNVPNDKIDNECLLKLIRIIIERNPSICIPDMTDSSVFTNVNLFLTKNNKKYIQLNRDVISLLDERITINSTLEGT